MRKLLLLSWLALFSLVNTAYAEEADPIDQDRQLQVEQNSTPDGVYNAEAYRSGRGSFSGGRTTPSPGISRGGGGYSTGPRAPSNNVRPNPRYTNPGGQPGYGGYPNRGAGLGGLLGGFAAGTLLGSLFHPFGLFGGGGYGTTYGSGFSFLGLIFWGVLIYFLIRWFRRARRKSL